MMIGKLLQTALISLTSGACLTQAPAFNNVKEPNNALTQSSIDLNTLYWKEQTASNTYQDNAISMEEMPGDQYIPKLVYMQSFYNVMNVNNAYIVRCRQLNWYEKISSAFVSHYNGITDYIVKLEAHRTYYIEVEPYYVNTTIKLNTEFNNMDGYPSYEIWREESDPMYIYQYTYLDQVFYNPENEAIKQKINNTNDPIASDFYVRNITNQKNWNSSTGQNELEYDGYIYNGDSNASQNVNLITTMNTIRSKYQIAIYCDYEIQFTFESVLYMETLQFWNEEQPTTGINDEAVILEINYNQNQTENTTPDVVDIPGMMFTIISLPFTFISQAFNLTIFPGTPYQINFSNILLIILTTLILLFIIRLIMRSRG